MSPLLCHLANCWSLLLSDLVFCANELCSSGGEYLGGGLPGLFTLITIVWHLISLLVAACVGFAPPPIQSKHTIALLATKIFWNREDHNVRKSLILSDMYDLVSSTFHMPFYEPLILICFKAKLTKERKRPLPDKNAPPPSLFL